jgi:SAM-dependent methyltransferase
MRTLEPDYDSDPGRWSSYQTPTDVHHVVGPELAGPVLDVGCGEGRLASVLRDGVAWVGLDASWSQLRANPHRPLVRADMGALPFVDGAFAEVTHLWCLYHLDDPVAAVAEARRVLRAGGRYYACSAARDSDPEILPEGYPRSTFDAEEAPGIVAEAFGEVEAERWDGRFYALETRDEIRAYCRHNFIPAERAESAELPLELTKRGVLVRAIRAPG